MNKKNMRDTISTLAYIIAICAGGYFFLTLTQDTPKKKKQEIILIDEARIAPGLALHTVRRTAKAWLVASDGTIEHKWDIKDYVPKESKYTLSKSPLQHVELDRDGSLLAVVKDSAIIRLDRNSKLLNETEGFFHHDIDILKDGTIVALERRPMKVDYKSKSGVLLNDHVVFLSKEGKRVKEFPLFEPVVDFISEEVVEQAFDFSSGVEEHEIKNDTPADVLHTNSIEIIEHAIAGISPANSALVSFRDIDLVAILSPDFSEILWSYGPGEIDAQHAPTFTEAGNILIFDNGREKKSSRVIEVNPKNKEIVWEYSAKDYPAKNFYSAARGSVQRLSNGNTLISLAERGYALEVTADKELVWKYAPKLFFRSKANNKRKARKVMIYRIEKIEDPKLVKSFT